MTNSPTQHALREVRRIYSTRLAQMILLAVALLLGISGPFGTLEAMNFGPRLAYWLVTVPLTFALGVFTSAFVAETTRRSKQPWLSPVLVSLSTAVTIGITVTLLNGLAFARSPLDTAHFGTPIFSIMATAAVIAFVFKSLSDGRIKPAQTQKQPPPLLDRLDFDKRGALISLSVQDHYVEVTTTKGTALVLIRLSDAMRETGSVQGVQIHRSHWVALSHITAARRDGDRAILTLSDGRDLPASRSNIKTLKEHGILPR
ncbi:MAG: LytTR family DNA-binding domain-containing protein [Planktotalea sp.]|uniref:LytTR family DNA-binding domain-containing protein n=1 Tax=Planktotalea sp. TaxID=2029877 RepID=UPI003C7132F0